MKNQQFIRGQVLRGITLNREPGYHFTGNFLDISFDHIGATEARLSMDAAPHCSEPDGQMNLGAFAVLADLALAATVRAGLDAAARLATVYMNLSFTGAPLTGRLEADSGLQGFLQGSAGRQGLSHVTVSSGGERVCVGSGSFMVLNPPKGVELYRMQHRKRGDPVVTPLADTELKRDEVKVLSHADAALEVVAAHGGSFIRRFWGYDPHHVEGGAACTVRNGPHIGNRVGHVQGGVLLGLAAATACGALTSHWMLTSISAYYISPGEGRSLKARARILHHGRLTSVVRTQITGKHNRRVLEVVTTHAFRAG
ncbi:MAG: PaaI family thioesterase [Betaproteobacteria bacterium]|nr:PaaI family thioesterase [Betaproteobacteria bacterium]